jgi:hypothetical protein
LHEDVDFTQKQKQMRKEQSAEGSPNEWTTIPERMKAKRSYVTISSRSLALKGKQTISIALNVRLASLPQLSPLRANPSLPELVFFYLPEKEWPTMDSLLKRRSGEVLTEHHVFLLVQEGSCSSDTVLQAWSEWHRIGLHVKGESQRKNLLMTGEDWGRTWLMSAPSKVRKLINSYRDVQTFLNGSEEEKADFLNRWRAKGLGDVNCNNGEWGSFTEFDDIREEAEVRGQWDTEEYHPVSRTIEERHPNNIVTRGVSDDTLLGPKLADLCVACRQSWKYRRRISSTKSPTE